MEHSRTVSVEGIKCEVMADESIVDNLQHMTDAYRPREVSSRSNQALCDTIMISQTGHSSSLTRLGHKIEKLASLDDKTQKESFELLVVIFGVMKAAIKRFSKSLCKVYDLDSSKYLIRCLSELDKIQPSVKELLGIIVNLERDMLEKLKNEKYNLPDPSEYTTTCIDQGLSSDGACDNEVTHADNRMTSDGTIRDSPSQTTCSRTLNETIKKQPLSQSRQYKKPKKKKTYGCEVCGKTAKLRKTIVNCTRNHVALQELQVESKSYDCDQCEKKYKNRSDLYTHRKLKHTPTCRRMYPCLLCDRIFKSAGQAEEHMNVHSGHKPFKCNTCKEGFPSRSSLANHIGRVHRLHRPYKCAICSMPFKYAFGRDTHYFKHSADDLQKHNIVLDRTKCDQCGKSMRRRSLQRHSCSAQQSKVNKDSFTPCICEMCGGVFQSSYGLRLHQNKAHGKDFTPDTQKPYLCNICGRGYASLASLNHHLSRHGSSKTCFCPVCGKQFSNKFTLRSHERLHTAKAFQCDICHKSFSVSQHLTLHYRTHTGEKPFSCDLCGRAFSLQPNFLRHMDLHFGHRKFKCNICNKRFGQKVQLQDHWNIHTGEKPYHCSVCGKTFSDRGSASKHKKKHSTETQLDAGSLSRLTA